MATRIKLDEVMGVSRPVALALVGRPPVNRLSGRVSHVRHPVRETGQLLGDARAMIELGARGPRLPVGLHRFHHRAIAVGLGGATSPASGYKNGGKYGKQCGPTHGRNGNPNASDSRIRGWLRGCPPYEGENCAANC
jgi:hypothetical protein